MGESGEDGGRALKFFNLDFVHSIYYFAALS